MPISEIPFSFNPNPLGWPVRPFARYERESYVPRPILRRILAGGLSNDLWLLSIYVLHRERIPLVRGSGGNIFQDPQANRYGLFAR